MVAVCYSYYKLKHWIAGRMVDIVRFLGCLVTKKLRIRYSVLHSDHIPLCDHMWYSANKICFDCRQELIHMQCFDLVV